MTEILGVPVQSGPGYTNDPYAGEGEAPFFLGTWIAKFTGESDGFISTYREWHIMCSAISAGLRAKTLENMPECPPLWTDEKQYWDTPGMIANVIKCQWPSVSVVIAAVGCKLLSGWLGIAI